MSLVNGLLMKISPKGDLLTCWALEHYRLKAVDVATTRLSRLMVMTNEVVDK